MPLPAIAAGAAKAVAVVGRAAVGVGKAAAGAGRAAGTAARTGAQATSRGAARAGQRASTMGRRAIRSGNQARRSASQMRSQFQQARRQAQQMQNTMDQLPDGQQNSFQDRDELDEEQDEEQNEETMSPYAQFRSATAMMRQAQAAQSMMSMQGVTPQASMPGIQGMNPSMGANPMASVAKSASKKMIQKSLVYIANSFASALELATGGIGMIFTFFIRFLTLGWYNVQMMLGGWLLKGKSDIIPPLDWDPIPMPFPKKTIGGNDLGKTLMVLLADVFLIIAIILPIVFIGTLFSILASANPF